MARRKSLTRPCVGCGIERPIQFRGFCSPCSNSLRRHEEDKPYRDAAEFHRLAVQWNRLVRRRHQ